MTPTQTAARAMSRCMGDLADRAAAIHGPEAYRLWDQRSDIFGRVWVVAGNGRRFITTTESDAATLRAALDLVREVAGR